MAYLDHKESADSVFEEIQVLDEEWVRRGRWTRAFLVGNTNGHVHSSMHCSTCYDTTEFIWLTEYSDHAEDEIVSDAGERACTVCYPTAPVDVLSRATKIFSPTEKAAQQAREERAAAKAERLAAMITLEVWDNVYFRHGKQLLRREVTWKTLRALQNDTGSLVRELNGAHAMINGFDLDIHVYGVYGSPGETRGGEHRVQAEENLEIMLGALKERGVDTDALVEKNKKRAVKERF
jgi:hypothetical protein